MNVGPDTLLGGRYRLVKRIASGGMGEVWYATDEVLGRTVAVKVLLPALLAEPGFAERFRAEARTMATISHPGVVNIFDYNSDQNIAYLVMEYVEGDALSKTLARVGRLTPGRTMALVAQAADALQAAHDRGIVHRDVKPGNLLVRPNGTLVLTDFGIARSEGAAQLTAVGSVLGTASYISPEQASGETATPLSDVYGLGVVAYQCLAGRRPFEGGNPVDIAMRHVREQPPPLPPDTPAVVRTIVGRALAKHPSARWPSAAAMAVACRNAAAGLAAGSSGTARAGAAHPPVARPGSGAPAGARPASGGPTGARPASGAPAGARPSGGGPAGARPASGAPAGARPAGGAVAAGRAGGQQYPAAAGQRTPGNPSGYPGQRGAPVRGAAAVPASPGPAPGHAPQPGLHPVQAASHGLPPGPVAPAVRRGPSGLAVTGAVILLVLLCAGGAYLVNQGNRNRGMSGGPGATATSGRQQTSPAGPTTAGPGTIRTSGPAVVRKVWIPCETLRRRTPAEVESILLGAGFDPHLVRVPGRNGKIVDITPCQARPGDTITVEVGDGSRSQGMATFAACDNPTGYLCVTPTSRS